LQAQLFYVGSTANQVSHFASDGLAGPWVEGELVEVGYDGVVVVVYHDLLMSVSELNRPQLSTPVARACASATLSTTARIVCVGR